MPSLPDTLRVLLVRFAFMVWNTASESTVLDQPELAWSSSFLQLGQNFLNYLVTLIWSTAPSPFAQQIVFWLLLRCYGSVRTCKAKVPKLDYVTLHLTNHIRSEAIRNVSAHQQPRYYQPHQIRTTTWTTLVTWYMRNKLGHTKILQNFSFALVLTRGNFSLFCCFLLQRPQRSYTLWLPIKQHKSQMILRVNKLYGEE